MAGAKEDFLIGDDFDAVLAIIDDDFLENDRELNQQLKEVVSEIGNHDTKQVFNVKHVKTFVYHKGVLLDIKMPNITAVLLPQIYKKKSSIPQSTCNVLYFKKYVESSVKMLAVDECYPEDITSEFQKYIGLVNVDNVNDCYQLVKEVIQGYNGNAEKFYPRFYKAVSDASRPFKTLSRNAGLILAFEVANHVLAHLSDSTLENDVITSKASAKFDEKEKAIIYYIRGGGYVFGTMYRRIFYKSTENNEQSFYHQQYLSILLA